MDNAPPLRRARTPNIERHYVDVHVGARLRLMRTLRGLSQAELAAEVDLSPQQLQKYESGANGLGASRLWRVAEALDVPVGFFFDDLGEAAFPASLAIAGEPSRNLSLVRYFDSIADEDVRAGVLDLLRRLAKAAP